MTATGWLAFLAAAGVGAPARYLLDEWVQERTEGDFPMGTLVVNLIGCFVLGVVTGLGIHHGLDAEASTVLGSGGMGAFTTFSAVSFETVRLVEEGDARAAARNVLAQALGGLLAAAAGLAVASLG